MTKDKFRAGESVRFWLVGTEALVLRDKVRGAYLVAYFDNHGIRHVAEVQDFELEKVS